MYTSIRRATRIMRRRERERERRKKERRKDNHEYKYVPLYEYKYGPPLYDPLQCIHSRRPTPVAPPLCGGLGIRFGPCPPKGPTATFDKNEQCNHLKSFDVQKTKFITEKKERERKKGQLKPTTPNRTPKSRHRILAGKHTTDKGSKYNRKK